MLKHSTHTPSPISLQSVQYTHHWLTRKGVSRKRKQGQASNLWEASQNSFRTCQFRLLPSCDFLFLPRLSQPDTVGRNLSHVSMNCWEIPGTTKFRNQQLWHKQISKSYFLSFAVWVWGIYNWVYPLQENQRIKASRPLKTIMLLTPALLPPSPIVNENSTLRTLALKSICFCSLPNSMRVFTSFICMQHQS